MNKNLNEIPIFFAVDDGYIPFLAVAMQSLVEHSSKENYYNIRILYTNICEENKEKIIKYEKENIKIQFVLVNDYIDKIKDKLYTRDYYTKTTYFRLFIPEIFTQYDKALYLDSDIVFLSDVADLYNSQMGDNLVAGIPDGAVQNIDIFKDYVEKVVGISSYKNYFNAGILLMNLKELREFKFQEKFLYLLETVKFTVAQDQDYLNRLCKGRVTLLKKEWNKMPIPGDEIKEEDIKLIHYNLAYKPWHFDDILYQKYFWKYAKETEFLETIQKIKENYTEEDKKIDRENSKRLLEIAQKEANCVGDDRFNRR